MEDPQEFLLLQAQFKVQQRMQQQVLHCQKIKAEHREAKARVLFFRSTKAKPAREEAAPFPVVGMPPAKDALGVAFLVEQRRFEMGAQVKGAVSASSTPEATFPDGLSSAYRTAESEVPAGEAGTRWMATKWFPPRPHRPSTELVYIFVSNSTMWGPKAEEFLATASALIWVVTETHLVGHSFHDLKTRMLRKGWDLYPAHTIPNTKSTPGAAALELGADPGKATTGGVLVAARRRFGHHSIAYARSQRMESLGSSNQWAATFPSCLGELQA